MHGREPDDMEARRNMEAAQRAYARAGQGGGGAGQVIDPRPPNRSPQLCVLSLPRRPEWRSPAPSSTVVWCVRLDLTAPGFGRRIVPQRQAGSGGQKKLVRSASVSTVDSFFNRSEQAPTSGGVPRAAPRPVTVTAHPASVLSVPVCLVRLSSFASSPQEAELLQLLTSRGHIFSGWLFKKGDFTGFQRRFFVLEGAYVKYYKQNPGDDFAVAPRGVIQLKGSVTTALHKRKNGYPFAFRVELEKTNGDHRPLTGHHHAPPRYRHRVIDCCTQRDAPARVSC